MELNTKTPEYWWADGTHAVFNKYYFDNNNHIVNKRTKKQLRYSRSTRGHYSGKMIDDRGKQHTIQIGRLLASTYHGKPPTDEHTADHINRNSGDDRIENIRWATKSEQNINRTMPKNLKSAFIIIKDDHEKTIQEWINHLKDQKNSFGRKYTASIIGDYARRRQFGFSYKEYPDLVGEVWKEIVGSKTKLGRWEISDMNRVKFITNHATNVISDDRFGLNKGYPIVYLNGKPRYCHVLSYISFFPKEYASKKQNEEILHKNDDKLDFRPFNLRLGTRSQNIKEAHDNGCYDGTKTARMRCASYINGIFEKEHKSQSDGMKYLKFIGFNKASSRNISMALSGDRNTAYGRTWKLIP